MNDIPMSDELKRALESPSASIHKVNELMIWLTEEAGLEADVVSKLMEVWATFGDADADRVRHLVTAHKVVSRLDGNLTNLQAHFRELALSNDELMRALDSERKNIRALEKSLARRIEIEMDMPLRDSQTVLDILTGDLDVYLSIYTKEDVMAVLREALDEIEQSRADMDADGGVAD